MKVFKEAVAKRKRSERVGLVSNCELSASCLRLRGGLRFGEWSTSGSNRRTQPEKSLFAALPTAQFIMPENSATLDSLNLTNKEAIAMQIAASYF